jgi:hypothetical protein
MGLNIPIPTPVLPTVSIPSVPSIPTVPSLPGVPGLPVPGTASIPGVTSKPQTNPASGTHHINTGSNFGFRHFTFILLNETGILERGPIVVELNINPEDLQQDTPYRVNATQTLGGAFVDVWGQGIRKIVLRGHTGWRRQTTVTQNSDGFENVRDLREKIFDKYFTIREQASAKMSHVKLESQLKITLIDRLHEKAFRVVPEVFRLLRNRTRPLLHMYEASFIIVDNDDEQKNVKQTILADADRTKALWAGFDKVQKDSDILKGKIASLGGPFKDALSSITNMSGGISGMFKGLITAESQFAKGIAGVRDVASQAVQAVHTGMGTIQSYVDFSGIAADALYVFNDVKSVMSDLLCLLAHIRAFGLFTYRGINGGSSCAALYGIPTSALRNTTNSFETINNGTGAAQLQTVANSISVAGQSTAQAILATDTPLLLIGEGT